MIGMNRPRIGMVGLGGIAQKAYLPILTNEKSWQFVGAYSPNSIKRKRICQQYRIEDFSTMSALIQACDAVFVHSSTESHYEVVSTLLQHGKDVYVDKPLAATLEEAERLVELSNKSGRKLMVGFNRRFAPMYVEAKERKGSLSALSFEKHRENGIGPVDYRFTMLDDYIHAVDFMRWFQDDEVTLAYQRLDINREQHLVYAQHVFEGKNGSTFTISMHRKAGADLEQLRLLTNGRIIQVQNLQVMDILEDGKHTIQTAPSWATILHQKGFEAAVEHFIGCIINDMKPLVDGQEGLKSQILVEKLFRK